MFVYDRLLPVRSMAVAMANRFAPTTLEFLLPKLLCVYMKQCVGMRSETTATAVEDGVDIISSATPDQKATDVAEAWCNLIVELQRW